MNSPSSLDITLLGREYRVACPPEERESLLAAVAFVGVKMADIAAKTKSNGERLAVMTALNLAHDLLVPKTPPEEASPPAANSIFDDFDRQEFARRIEVIEARLDAAMAEQDKLF